MSSKPAYNRAQSYLNALILNLRGKGFIRLPTLKHLCLDAQVSPVIMEKALESFRKSGEIYSRQGAGIFIKQENDSDLSANQQCKFDFPEIPETCVRQKVHDRLVADLLDGQLARGSELPGFKALCEYYGVSYRPLKTALDTMVADGQLEYRRRRYRVPAFEKNSDRQTLVLIARGQQDGTVSLLSPWIGEMLRALQQQCSYANCTLMFAQGYFENVEPLYHPDLLDILNNGARQKPVSGFVYITDGMELFPNEHMLQKICALGKPVALIDNVSCCAQFLHKLPPRLVTLYTATGGQRPGYAVGNYLVARGHRSIAFFTPDNTAPWSRNRHNGIVRAFEKYHIKNKIHLFNCDTRLDDPEVSETHARTGEFTMMIERAAGMSFHYNTIHSALWQLNMNIGRILMESLQAKKMASQLDAALDDKSITAWVAANDAMAVICMDFLITRNVAIGDRLALVSFDDSDEALFRNLSSFNFNIPALVHRIFSSVFYPPLKPKHIHQKQPLEVNGFLVRRRSG